MELYIVRIVHFCLLLNVVVALQEREASSYIVVVQGMPELLNIEQNKCLPPAPHFVFRLLRPLRYKGYFISGDSPFLS